MTSSVINDAEANAGQNFATNKVITSKYTWWNFIFIFLYENLNPLNKFANFYFVCVAICEVLLPLASHLVHSCHFDYKRRARVPIFARVCAAGGSDHVQ